MSQASQIHLIYEPFPVGSPPNVKTSFRAIAVPDRPRYLTLNEAGAPRLGGRPFSRASALVVEPLYDESQPRLLLLNLSSGGRPARVNGRPAPRTALLAVADQIRFEEHLLHVTSFNRPRVGPVSQDEVGGRCPMCSLAFERGDVAYTCSHCRSRLHLKSRPRERNEVLRCATFVRECSKCRRPIDLEEGWSFVPDEC